MGAIASQITSLTIVFSTVYSDADQRKHQSSASLAFVWEIHRDRWIPHTKGQFRGKCFHLMTSSCSGFLYLYYLEGDSFLTSKLIAYSTNNLKCLSSPDWTKLIDMWIKIAMTKQWYMCTPLMRLQHDVKRLHVLSCCNCAQSTLWDAWKHKINLDFDLVP